MLTRSNLSHRLYVSWDKLKLKTGGEWPPCGTSSTPKEGCDDDYIGNVRAGVRIALVGQISSGS